MRIENKYDRISVSFRRVVEIGLSGVGYSSIKRVSESDVVGILLLHPDGICVITACIYRKME